jgi:hypothetical protein
MVNRYSSEIVVVITATEWDDTPSTTVLRFALYGGRYVDTVSPSGPKKHYQGAIKSDIVFKKQIGIEFWKESSAIDFGYIDVAIEDQADELIDFAENVTVADVDLYRVNLSSPDENQLEILASARTSDIGFADEHTLRLRLESVLQGGFDAPINERYYGYEYPHLTGKPYPIAWGLITDPYQVLPTIEVDGTTLDYHITDIEIDSFETFVYDRGVALLPTTEFTPTTYGFTLLQNPDGKITSGRVLLIDPEGNGSDHMHGLFRFVRLAMTRAGLWSYANQTELQQLETDIGMGDLFPQFFTMSVVSLENFLKKIMAGVTGWWYVDELAEIHFGRMIDTEDGTPGYAFTDTNTSGRIKVEDDKAPGLTSRLSYAYSPGAYDEDEIAGSVYGQDRVELVNKEHVVDVEGYIQTLIWTADSDEITADSDVITADGYAGEELVDPTTRSYWSRVEVRVPIEIPMAYSESPSAFDLADAEVTRWWSELYYKRRRFYTFTVQLNDTQFDSGLPQLGEFCTLQSDRFKLLSTAKTLFIRRLSFNFSKNQLTIEGWG